MVDYFAAIGHAVRFFFRATEMAKGFKVPVINSQLQVAGIKQVAFKAAPYTG